MIRTSVPGARDCKVLAVWNGADLSGAPGAFTSRCACRRRSFTCSSKACDESSARAVGVGEVGEGDALEVETINGEAVEMGEGGALEVASGNADGVPVEGAGVASATV